MPRRATGRRPTVSASLHPDDYAWLQSLPGSSESWKVSQVIRAARLHNLRIDSLEFTSATSELATFAGWLKSKRGTEARAIYKLLQDFLNRSANT